MVAHEGAGREVGTYEEQGGNEGILVDGVAAEVPFRDRKAPQTTQAKEAALSNHWVVAALVLVVLVAVAVHMTNSQEEEEVRHWFLL